MTEQLQVMVASWELGCCGSPLHIGDEVTWALLFRTDEPDPVGAPSDAVWAVSELAPPGPGWSARLLRAGAVRATWVGQGPPPPTGRHRLRGHLGATWHGGLLEEEMVPTTGRIERIQVVAQRFDEVAIRPAGGPPGRVFEPVPGSARFQDVGSAPDGLLNTSGPAGGETSYRADSGWLVDLRVRP